MKKEIGRNRAGASCDDCVRPDYLLFLFGLPLLFPFFKFPLPLYALVESENIRQDTAGDGLNLMLGNVGVVDGFLSLAQRLSSVSRFTKAQSSSFRVLCRSLLLGSVDRLSLLPVEKSCIAVTRTLRSLILLRILYRISEALSSNRW